MKRERRRTLANRRESAARKPATGSPRSGLRRRRTRVMAAVGICLAGSMLQPSGEFSPV